MVIVVVRIVDINVDPVLVHIDDKTYARTKALIKSANWQPVLLPCRVQAPFLLAELRRLVTRLVDIDIRLRTCV